MTTIAYKDEVMAADTQITAGGMRVGFTMKLSSLKDGSLVGFCGQCSSKMAAFRRLDLLVKLARLQEVSLTEVETDEIAWPKGDYEILLVEPNGQISVLEAYKDEEHGWIDYANDYHSIGSGSPFALTAMDCGMSAINAVSAAMMRDLCTGGDVFYLRLHAAGAPVLAGDENVVSPT